jgi:hypothetical protein
MPREPKNDPDAETPKALGQSNAEGWSVNVGASLTGAGAGVCACCGGGGGIGDAYIGIIGGGIETNEFGEGLAFRTELAVARILQFVPVNGRAVSLSQVLRNLEWDLFDTRARGLQLCSEPGLLLNLFVTVTALNVTRITECIRNVTPALLAASCDKLGHPGLGDHRSFETRRSKPRNHGWLHCAFVRHCRQHLQPTARYPSRSRGSRRGAFGPCRGSRDEPRRETIASARQPNWATGSASAK